ncbi:hydroxyacylglutathione hydrolase [Brevundimonas bacteroides]|uniref:hydroxyacylglutathione hydrolase n=1 Tax=Brevundimonas bacteroides TaxID=74311 RepID=UPI000496DE2C|nr:hydroxyacylglutathione hydrolase [Brevundimonas bacteroides]
MPLTVHLFPAREDNYAFLARDEATGTVAAIDTPDAQVILDAIQSLGWGKLDRIINTHWHPDHTEGNERLKADTGCDIWGPEEVRKVAPVDHIVEEGDVVTIGETTLHVTATPGHTLGHVVFRSIPDNIAFTGDTLFTLGCGRLFEGTPEQMWDSLQRIAAWPDETVLYGAHEYTASNARFMLSVDDRPEVRAHAEGVFTKRALGEPTVPTTLGVERRFNPYLTARDGAEFAARRAAKDVFKG